MATLNMKKTYHYLSLRSCLFKCEKEESFATRFLKLAPEIAAQCSDIVYHSSPEGALSSPELFAEMKVGLYYDV